ncbi:unnamed protein product [Acanthoscelides obtectus]|uniref:Odorant receptor n=3 Tax=Acanthoscelides obtectus TaxID=200917 RepID=A0A9P0LVX3_ACAOB|nr:unnamed protein product [Acanthoscelides obtectus]CAK1678431.1 Odorant receptor 33a [Acanthoscelides obtectus]
MFIYTTTVTNWMMVVCIFLNSEDVHAMICQLESAAFQPKSQKEYSYIHEWKGSAYFIKKLFYGLSLTLTCLAPIVGVLQGKTAPLVSYIPPWIHWRVYFWLQALVSVCNATMGATYISFLCTMLIEAIIQVACLKERLQFTEDRRCLVECIERYSEITEFTKRLHHICKIGLSAVIVAGVLNTCTTFSLIVKVKFIELAFLVPYMSSIVAIIYIHCFYGTILATESEDIPYSLFSSKWINTDDSHKRTLLLFMVFSKKQITIKLVGGTLTMSLPLFVQIMRTAYAYFNVLQSVE